jgi:hypothetical protein
MRNIRFYGWSAGALGTYELAAIATGRCPTISTYCARNRYRRMLMVLWALGLVVHIARHTAPEP